MYCQLSYRGSSAGWAENHSHTEQDRALCLYIHCFTGDVMPINSHRGCVGGMM